MDDNTDTIIIDRKSSLVIQEDSRKRYGKSIYHKNPFLITNNKSQSVSISDKKTLMLIHGDGTNLPGNNRTDMAGFWEVEEVDNEKFIKLFIRGVQALKKLSPSGTKIFEILYLRISENMGKDCIYLGFQDIDQDTTLISRSTYCRGIRELIEKSFIAQSASSGFYWINPAFIWNGDRVDFLRTFYRKRLSSSS